MNSKEVTVNINLAIAKAEISCCRQFAESALTTLFNAPELESIDSSGELNEAGLTAFHAARTGFLTATSKTIAEWIESIGSGTQFEGNMQAELLFALIALEGWSEFLAGNRSGIEAIADQLLSLADYLEAMPSNDALASAKVAETYRNIMVALEA